MVNLNEICLSGLSVETEGIEEEDLHSTVQAGSRKRIFKTANATNSKKMKLTSIKYIGLTHFKIVI